MTLEKPLRFSGLISLAMTDTVPLVRYFTEQHQFMKYFGGILDVKDIQGSSRVELNADWFHISDLRITGDILNILGKLRMNSTSKRGALYVKFRKLPFMVTLEDDRKTPHLIRPLRKFHEFDVLDQ